VSHQSAVFEVARLWKVKSERVFPWAKHQVVKQLNGHVHQHQTHQDFVGVEPVAQPRHQRGPHHAAQHPSQQHHGVEPSAGFGAAQQGHATGGNGAQHKLTLGTNVPYVGAKTHRQPQGNEQQRRGFDHQLAPGVAIAYGFNKKQLNTAPWVFAQRGKQRHANQRGNQQRKQG
jgi:hypothetical protein